MCRRKVQVVCPRIRSEAAVERGILVILSFRRWGTVTSYLSTVQPHEPLPISATDHSLCLQTSNPRSDKCNTWALTSMSSQTRHEVFLEPRLPSSLQFPGPWYDSILIPSQTVSTAPVYRIHQHVATRFSPVMVIKWNNHPRRSSRIHKAAREPLCIPSCQIAMLIRCSQACVHYSLESLLPRCHRS